MSDKEIIAGLHRILNAPDQTHQQALVRSLGAGGAGDRAAEVLGEQSLALLGFERLT